MPTINQIQSTGLRQSYPVTDSSRTAFLTASLLLQDLLQDDRSWRASTGQFAAAYFKRFKGQATEPHRSNLLQTLYTKLNKNLQDKVTGNDLVGAVADYENLPDAMEGIQKNPATAWAMAEAYRKLEQLGKSIPFYRRALQGADPGPDRFKVQYRLSVVANRRADQLLTLQKNVKTRTRLTDESRRADTAALSSWRSLNPQEKTTIAASFKDDFETAIRRGLKLRTPPKVILERLSTDLSSSLSTGSGVESSSSNYAPSAASVHLLNDLQQRFSELGLSEERKATLALLEQMTPENFGGNKDAQKIWTSQLIDLAETYRKDNRYLDAGRLFQKVATSSEDWSGRAEALYKSGLLLYRGGQRSEALEAFKAAADDGSNVFYANLARERLAQMN